MNKDNNNLRNISYKELDQIILESILERLPYLKGKKLSSQLRFFEDIKADSVDVIAIWIKVEQKLLPFNIDLSQFLEDNSLINVKTLGDFRNFICQKIKSVQL